MAALAYRMVEAVRERDRLAGEVRQLRTDLQKQTQRNHDLEAEVEGLRKAPKR
jgi:cell division protein FtsB